MDFTVYLAPKGFVKELVYELGEVTEVVDRLVFAPGPPRPVAWAQNIWLDPRRIPIESISDAAGKLKALQRNWSLFSVRHHRRAKLIEEQLPAVVPKPVRIGTPPPRAPLGSWTLLDRDMVVASPTCLSPFPHGEVTFLENKTEPPSRAYLKLWELFTLMETAPSPGDVCLDLGGSPGGWTWVLASLGCKVLCVDKAPLDPRVEAMPGVEYRQLSAFALDPREVGPVDWLFCDVICYPDRLWRLVDRWRTFGKVRNFVCTLKFQANTDHDTAAKFWAMPGSQLRHLSNNKHELTWVLLEGDQDQDEECAPAGESAPVPVEVASPPDIAAAAGDVTRESTATPEALANGTPVCPDSPAAGEGSGIGEPGSCEAAPDEPSSESAEIGEAVPEASVEAPTAADTPVAPAPDAPATGDGPLTPVPAPAAGDDPLAPAPAPAREEPLPPKRS